MVDFITKKELLEIIKEEQPISIREVKKENSLRTITFGRDVDRYIAELLDEEKISMKVNKNTDEMRKTIESIHAKSFGNGETRYEQGFIDALESILELVENDGKGGE